MRPASVVLLLLLAVALTAADAAGRPFLHPLFTDRVVIQQGKPVPVWGWTTPDSTVSVRIGTKTWSSRADRDGRWEVEVGPYRVVDGPLEMSVTGGENRLVHDIAVGEVWVCAGQSNMFWFLNAVEGADREVAQATVPGLRLFSLFEKSTPDPLVAPEAIIHQWAECIPGLVGNFSAVGYYLGRGLHEKLQVPVGLISIPYGGTTAETWMSEAAVRSFGEFGEQLEALDAARPALRAGTFDFGASKTLRSIREVPTLAANAMRIPLGRFPVAGVAWYQGESNGSRGRQYARLLPALIADWRQQWNDPALPFVIVQLAGYGQPVAEPTAEDNGWVGVMEAQARTAAEVPHCGLACAYDQGDAGDVHPRRKSEVGRRVANAALALVYGKKDVLACGPRVSSISREGPAVRVRFADVGTGLAVHGTTVTTFALQDREGRLHRAIATIDRDSALVRSAAVADPERIQFAYEPNPPGELYNSDGMPAVPFRRDVPR